MAGPSSSYTLTLTSAPPAAPPPLPHLNHRLSAALLKTPPPSMSISGRQRTLPILRPRAAADGDNWGSGHGYEAAPAAVVAAPPPEIEVGELKRLLVDRLYGTNRGLTASSETRAEIAELIAQLEAENPTPAPTEALPLLNGKWILVYTSFAQLFPILGAGYVQGIVKVDEISQTIDSENFCVENCVKFSGPIASSCVTTNAKFEVRSPKRVQIKFEEGIIGTPQLTDSIVIPEKAELLGQSIDLSLVKGVFTSIQDAASSVTRSIFGQPPLKFPINNSSAQSWLLTTYLDEDLRISRSDGNNVFVLIKEGNLLLN